MKQDILNLENKNVGSIELNDSIYGLEVRADILQRVVNWQLARLQSGNHATKGRSDVALTAAKPFKQKLRKFCGVSYMLKVIDFIFGIETNSRFRRVGNDYLQILVFCERNVFLILRERRNNGV